MRMQLYDPSASKRPVNVALNSDLVARARAAGLNLSALAEEAVAIALGRIVQKKFLLTHYPQPISDDTEHEHRDWTEGL